MTLDDACARYWNEHGQFLPTAWDVIDPNFRQMLAFFGKSKFIDEIDDAEVTRFKTHLLATPIGQKKKKPIAPGTVNRKLETLGALQYRAHEIWGVEAGQREMGKHKMRTPQARTPCLSVEQADRLIAVAAPHLKRPIMFALMTGVRLSNITGLRWEQISLHERKIRFQVKSKLLGGKLHELPITDSLFTFLIEQGPQATGYVFLRHFKPSEKTGKQRAPEPIKQFRNSFRTACKKAQLGDFRFHDLRHTAASWMRRNGIPIEDIKEVLGHEDVRMSLKYAHVDTAAKLRALNALPMAHIRHNTEEVKKG